ncbi:unnamed protein product [Paramecium primaurelia]|uniref:Uncharacterized protein n=1 Tax=Paramecium primaurelia TaxID=5886 RepID=A0A8S1PAD1_PARPR|nr:unnamed protein product [Paramecium primaurelia]
MNNYHLDYYIVQEINLKLMVVQGKFAYYSAELFLNILEKHLQRIEFIKLFADLDNEEYKLLQLSTHVLTDKKLQDKGLIAFKIIKYLKDERPHFNPDCILEIKKLKEQFENWYKSVRVQQIQERIQQTTWKESDQGLPENLNLQRETYYFIMGWKSNQNFLSFYSLIENYQIQQKQNKLNNKLKIWIKLLLKFILILHNFMLNILKNNIIINYKIIYDYALIIKYRMNKNIVYYFIDDFFCINQGILQIHNEFISKEFKIKQREKSHQHQMISQIYLCKLIKS